MPDRTPVLPSLVYVRYVGLRDMPFTLVGPVTGDERLAVEGGFYVDARDAAVLVKPAVGRSVYEYAVDL